MVDVKDFHNDRENKKIEKKNTAQLKIKEKKDRGEQSDGLGAQMQLGHDIGRDDRIHRTVERAQKIAKGKGQEEAEE